MRVYRIPSRDFLLVYGQYCHSTCLGLRRSCPWTVIEPGTSRIRNRCAYQSASTFATTKLHEQIIIKFKQKTSIIIDTFILPPTYSRNWEKFPMNVSFHLEQVQCKEGISVHQNNCVRFQVLTAASMMFRSVFWVILPCKMIVDRRFRGAYCLHHQG
jgi:hypothetical protein